MSYMAIKFSTAVLITWGMIMVSCVSQNPNNTTTQQTSNRLVLDSTSRFYDQNYRIYTLDSCEYIVVGYGNTKWGSHKGDCKNPKHKRQ